LYELRPGNNRVFFFYYKDKRFVLLHGFRKKGRKTPLHEIETARKRMEDFIRRYS
jgi:phage-related protein